MSKLPGWDREEGRDDDWLTEQDDFDWLDDPRYYETGPAEESAQRVGSARDRAAAGARERQPAAPSAVVMRRRRIAAVAAFAIIAAVGIGVAVAESGGGGSNNATPPLTPTPQPAPPAATPPAPQAPQPPAAQPKPKASLPKVTLPSNGQLASGDNGPQVVALQKVLKALGFYSGSPDGDFGPATKDAVVAFQTDRGLSPDGIVGSTTAAKLNAAAASAG
jgi:Putative peptidoglycan binding domain